MTAKSREERLFAALVNLADSMVSDFDPIDLADRLVSNCLEYLPIDSAGILLTDFRGGLRVLASTSEEIRLMEILESQSRQGACVVAVESGEPASVLNPAEYADRWPDYVRELHDLEITAAYAIPLRLREHTIGAVNLFCTRGHTLNEQTNEQPSCWPAWRRWLSSHIGLPGKRKHSRNNSRPHSAAG